MPRPLVLAPIAAALVLSACGGGSDSNGPADKLNALCKDNNAQVKKLGKQLNGQAKNDAPVVEQLLKVAQEGDSRLDGVTFSGDKKIEFDLFRTASKQRIRELQQLLDAARTGDDPTYRAEFGVVAASGKRRQAAFKRTSEELGAPDCAT